MISNVGPSIGTGSVWPHTGSLVTVANKLHDCYKIVLGLAAEAIATCGLLAHAAGIGRTAWFSQGAGQRWRKAQRCANVS